MKHPHLEHFGTKFEIGKSLAFLTKLKLTVSLEKCLVFSIIETIFQLLQPPAILQFVNIKILPKFQHTYNETVVFKQY